MLKKKKKKVTFTFPNYMAHLEWGCVNIQTVKPVDSWSRLFYICFHALFINHAIKPRAVAIGHWYKGQLSFLIT